MKNKTSLSQRQDHMNRFGKKTITNFKPKIIIHCTLLLILSF